MGNLVQTAQKAMVYCQKHGCALFTEPQDGTSGSPCKASLFSSLVVFGCCPRFSNDITLLRNTSINIFYPMNLDGLVAANLLEEHLLQENIFVTSKDIRFCGQYLPEQDGTIINFNIGDRFGFSSKVWITNHPDEHIPGDVRVFHYTSPYLSEVVLRSSLAAHWPGEIRFKALSIVDRLKQAEGDEDWGVFDFMDTVLGRPMRRRSSHEGQSDHRLRNPSVNQVPV